MKKRLCSLFITLIMLFSILIPFPSEAATGAFPVASFTQDFDGVDTGVYKASSTTGEKSFADLKTATNFEFKKDQSWTNWNHVNVEVASRSNNKMLQITSTDNNAHYQLDYAIGAITKGQISVSFDFFGTRTSKGDTGFSLASFKQGATTNWGLSYKKGEFTFNSVSVSPSLGSDAMYHLMMSVSRANETENWTMSVYDNKDASAPRLLGTKELTDINSIDTVMLARSYASNITNANSAVASGPLTVVLDNVNIVISAPIPAKTFDQDGTYSPEQFELLTGLSTMQSVTVADGKASLSGVNDEISFELPSAFEKGAIEAKMSVSDETVTDGAWELFKFISADGQESAVTIERNGAEYTALENQPIATEGGMHELKAVISRADETDDWELYFFDENDDQNELKKQIIPANLLSDVAEISLISGNGAISMDDVSFGYYDTLYDAIGSNVRVKVKDAYSLDTKKVTFNVSEAIDPETLENIVVTAPSGPTSEFRASVDEETGKILTLYFPSGLLVTGTYTVDLTEVKVLERQIAIEKTVEFEGQKTLQPLEVIDYPTEISQDTLSIDITFNQEIETSSLEELVTITKADGSAISGETNVTGEGSVVSITFEKMTLGTYKVRVSDALSPKEGLSMAAPFEFEFVVSSTVYSEDFELEGLVTGDSYTSTQMGTIAGTDITWRSEGKFVADETESGNKYIKMMTPTAGGGSGMTYYAPSEFAAGTFEFSMKLKALGTSNSRIMGTVSAILADDTTKSLEILGLDNSNKIVERSAVETTIGRKTFTSTPVADEDGFNLLKWQISSLGATQDWSFKLFDMNTLTADGEGTLVYQNTIPRSMMKYLRYITYYLYEGPTNGVVSETQLAAGFAVDDIKAGVSYIPKAISGGENVVATDSSLTLDLDMEIDTTDSNVKLVKVADSTVEIATDISYNETNRELTISPKSYLEPNTEYKVVFEKGGVEEYTFTTKEPNVNVLGDTTLTAPEGVCNVSYSVRVKNNSQTLKSVKVLLIAYDENGRIVKTGSGLGEIAAGDNDPINVTLSGLNGERVNSYKTIVWEKVDDLGYRFVWEKVTDFTPVTPE